MQNYYKSLNTIYKNTPALYENGFTKAGFEWISHDDHENSVMSYIRKGHAESGHVVVICNLTPAIREHYKIGVPVKGKLKEIFNSDSKEFGGSGVSHHILNITTRFKIVQTTKNQLLRQRLRFQYKLCS